MGNIPGMRQVRWKIAPPCGSTCSSFYRPHSWPKMASDPSENPPPLPSERDERVELRKATEHANARCKAIPDLPDFVAARMQSCHVGVSCSKRLHSNGNKFAAHEHFKRALSRPILSLRPSPRSVIALYISRETNSVRDIGSLSSAGSTRKRSPRRIQSLITSRIDI